MKPAWDQLTEEFANSKSVGIFDVDCTAGGKDLCEEVGVQGYPTIKYGDPSDKKALKDYNGGRTFDDMKKFAEENLGPVCNLEALDACSEQEKELIEKFLKVPSSVLDAEHDKLAKKFAGEQKALKKKVTKSSEKLKELEDDLAELGSKPKKGKEEQWKKKSEKLQARKDKIVKEQEANDAEGLRIKDEMQKAGMKLMKMASKKNKGRTDL
eukprot:TRINITY_DN1575_c0_g1_i1.p1 TRINITY_DN1575_c0_g1~~TRINITY_DN1575_c0_g1_i1.p1  ORF type:complete len:211 (+),score=80.27 TRINITY_DN1575_c0_g1_i1:214-846(+)